MQGQSEARTTQLSGWSRSELEGVLEVVPSAVVLVDNEGNSLHLNARARELYGADHVGQDMDTHLADVRALALSGDPLPPEQMPVRCALRGERVYNVEMLVHRADGAAIPVLVSASPLEDASGQRVGAVVLFDDISERTQREEEARFLAELAERLSSVSSEEGLMAVVGEALAERLVTDHVLFARIHEDEGKANVTTSWGAGRIPDVTGVHRLSDFITPEFEDSARCGQTIVINDTQTDPRTDAAAYAALNIFAYVTVPFIRDGGWRYLLAVNDSRPRQWTEQEVQIISRTAALAFPRLERARAEAALVERECRLDILNHANTLLLACDVPESVIQPIAELVMEHLEADVFFNYVLDEGGERLRLNAWGGIDESVAKMIEHRELGQAICGCVARDGTRVVSQDVQTNGDERADLVRALGVRSYVCHPLEVDGEAVGTLSFGTKRKARFCDDEIEFMQVIARQVSVALEKHARQRALHDSEERFRSVLEDALDAAYRRDLVHDRYDYISPVIEQFIGFTAEESAALSYEEVSARVHPDDLPQVARALEESLRTGMFEADYRFRRKDGSYVWMADRARTVTDKDGTPLFRSGVVRDISAKRRLEEQQEASEAKVQDLLRYAPTGIFEVAFDPPRFLTVNDAMASLTGYSHQELYALDPFALLDDESRERFATRIKAYLADEDVSPDVEYGVIRKDGRHLRAALNTQLLRTGDGRPFGAFVIAHDVTERRRTEDELRQSEQRYRTLYQVADALGETMELQDTLDTLAESTLAAVPDARVGIGLVERDGLRVATSRGASPTHPPVLVPWDDITPALREVIRAGRSAIVDYDALAPEIRDRVGQFEGRLLLWVPVVRGDEVLGVIGIDGPGERREFEPAEVELVQAMASQAAVAIENARLFESERFSASLNSALSDVSAELSSMMDIDEVMPSVLSRISDAIGASGASILLREEGQWLVTHATGLRQDLQGTRWEARALPSHEHVFTTRTPLLVDDVEQSDIVNREVAARQGFRAVGIYPLLVRGQPIGTISIIFEQPRAIGERVTEFMARAAYVLSSALENARLYEVEHNIAETLQETLVVLPAHVPGIEFARAYESATYQSGWVGGDFVDIFEVGPDEVGIVIGDVSGKGIEAAATTSLVRNTVRAHAVEGLAPGEVCDKTNRVVFRFSDVEEYVTMFFGVLETSGGMLRYASAGHPPALVILSEGGILELPVTGAPMIGAFDEARYKEQQITMKPGDRLVLYTDGVTEARTPDGMRWFGADGLRHAIDRHRREPTARLPLVIMQDIVTFSAGILRDDVAILALEPTRVRPPADDEREPS